jgi:hypothetical protein
VFTGNDPIADKVLRTGDLLFGDPVTEIRLSHHHSINDLGEITFLVSTLTPNPHGNYRSYVVRARLLESQTITFGALSNKTCGDPPLTVSAIASSGLPVSFSSDTTSVCTVSGTQVTIVAAGACTIRASQAGNGSYAPAPDVTQTFTVNKGTQTITFGPLPFQGYGAAPFDVSATASSALLVSFSSNTTSVCTVAGSTVTVVAAGTCTIEASQTGSGNWFATAPVDQSFTVGYGILNFMVLSGNKPTTEVKSGSSITAQFGLVGASGRIPTAVVQSVGCNATVSFNGGSPQCATYTARTQLFSASSKTPKGMTIGASYPVAAIVVAADGTRVAGGWIVLTVIK